MTTMPPPYAAAHRALAEAAHVERDRRRAMYPDLVAKGRVTAIVARADTMAWEAIAADWLRITEGTRPPVFDVQIWRKREATATALDRATRHAAARPGPDAERRRDLLAALHWHYRRARPTIWDCLDGPQPEPADIDLEAKPDTEARAA